MLRASVCVAVYNEGQNAIRLLNSVISQERLPEEIVIVDDGSTDQTYTLISQFVDQYKGPIKIKAITQPNRGPAAARNLAWKTATGDICVFTDGDCVPQKSWLSALIPVIELDDTIFAVGGIYAEPQTEKLLARFIGYEIAWRYSRMPLEINCHGTYNLAIRRVVLEQLGGFNEKYPKPSGEDFDLTYRISKLGKLRLVRESRVEHDHPDEFWGYMKNQYRRGYDRVRLYLDHPDRANNDSYTDSWVKFEVIAAAMTPYLVLCSLIWTELSWKLLALILGFLVASSLRTTRFLIQQDSVKLGLFGAITRFCRVFAWSTGMQAGILAKLTSSPS